MKFLDRISSVLPVAVAMLAILPIMLSCSDDPIESDNKDETEDVIPNNGILLFTNPAEGRSISGNGETVTCVLESDEDYEAVLDFGTDQTVWAEIVRGGSGQAGLNNIRIVFQKNETDLERSVDLIVNVSGHLGVPVARFTQSADGMSDAVKQNIALNTYMHEILLEEYLWADEYAGLDVDLKMDYTDFLFNHLTMLGDVNIEDGGRDRFNKNARFIYSNIQEMATLTKAVETGGLGIGPLFASQLTEDGLMGLSIAYVHQGSPAHVAGLKRGDTIYKVNGTLLTASSKNYQSYMNQIYYSPSGTYTFEFIRNADFQNTHSVEVSVGNYVYNPVLYSAVLKEGSHSIGYLVLENFDLNGQEFLVDILDRLAEEKITDLILDLRFNPGGAVAQSRYLTSAIAGTSHLDDTFVKVTFRDGSSQNWKFRGGPNDQDNLGIAADLGLERLYVIGSYGTASASELVINSLRGIDFPVYLYGGRTEGKNVGMTTTQTTYNGRKYLFSPITFWVANAKGFGDYPDGFTPDVIVNNQNDNYGDDIDNMFPYSFGDWADMGFNKALDEAYKDIVGTTRSAHMAHQMGVIPVESTPIKQVPGRYGNVIYL